MSNSQLVTLKVNGKEHEIVIEPRRTLADVLRHDLLLTGTHIACEHGICGACTVLVNNQPTRSCLMFGVQADGKEIETVESVGSPEDLNDVQAAFTKHHALQCGFCTPGFIMLAEGALRESPCMDREQVRELVSRNLCRCTGYEPIVDAIEEAAAQRCGSCRITKEDAPC